MILRIAAAGAMLAAAGCAAQTGGERAEANAYAPARASAEQAECFNANWINGFSEVDRDTVRVRVGTRDYYDIDVTPACYDLDFSSQIAVTTRVSSNLCVDRGAGQGDIVTRENRCPIMNVSHSPRRPAEESETAALDGEG